MSFIPMQKLKGRSLIAQFVVEQRPSGAILPYSEYQYIDQWLKQTSEDDLLLILNDRLPKLYANSSNRSHPASLARIDKRVIARIQGNQKRQNF